MSAARELTLRAWSAAGNGHAFFDDDPRTLKVEMSWAAWEDLGCPQTINVTVEVAS